MKKLSKVKTFRLGTKHERILIECFEKLRIDPDNFNRAMISFIEKVSGNLKELKKLRGQIKDRDEQIELLERGIKQSKMQIPSKPQLPKSEPLRHTKPIQQPHVSTKSIDKDDWVVCPDKNEWVRTSVECNKCREENFKKFKDCWVERRRHPFSDLFKCSKPKPNL